MADEDDVERFTRFKELGIEVDLSDEWEPGEKIEMIPEENGIRVQIEMVHRTTGETRLFVFFHQPF